jgi:hypothetical protein
MAVNFPTFKYSNLVAQTDDAYKSPLIFKPDLEPTPPLSAGGTASGEDGFYGFVKELMDPAKQDAREKARLQNLLGFQKEQMKQAAPYKLMFELPGQVMQAFAVPAQIRSNIMLAGQGAANQLLQQGLQSSAFNMPSMGYERPSTKYFS